MVKSNHPEDIGLSKVSSYKIEGKVRFGSIYEDEYILVDWPMESLHCVNPASGDLRWTFRNGGYLATSNISSNGYILVVGGGDNYVCCVDLSTGVKRWKVQIRKKSEEKGGPGMPHIDKDRGYLGDSRGNIYCLDLNNGNTVWKNNIGGTFSSRMSTWGEDLYAVSDKNKSPITWKSSLYLLDKTNGKVKKKIFGEEKHAKIYVLSDNKMLTCFHGKRHDDVVIMNKKGNEIKSLNVDDVIKIDSYSYNTYITSNDKGLMKIENEDAKVAWSNRKVNIPESNKIGAPIVSESESNIYVRGEDRICELEKNTGVRERCLITGGKVVSVGARMKYIYVLRRRGNSFVFKST